MKKIIIVAMVLLASVSGAKAQNAVGSFSLKPMAGMTIANMTNVNGSAKVCFIGGVEGEYQVTPIFSISAGALYSMQGSKSSDDGETAKIKSEYINVPILANVYITKGFAVKAGIQPGFLTSAKVSVTDGKASSDYDIKDCCKSLDFSIPVGLSYEYEGFVLDARYNIGLTDVFDKDTHTFGDDSFEFNRSKNSVFTITLGYKFSL